jgi:scyllo-inositol 2-dehydrogenase (NADP+)
MGTKGHSLVIIGFGGMGKFHSESIAPVEGVKVVGTFDIAAERQELARSLGFHAYGSREEALADPNVDMVLIATPNQLHKEIAIAALRAGKHVICEKPVALSSAQLRDILNVEKKGKGKFFVHQNRRWDPDYLTVKKIYDEKLLGDIWHLEQHVQGSRGVPGDWRRRPECGGGMMLDWGVHLIDHLLVMIPERITQVFCKLNFPTRQTVDEGFHLFLTFESGTTALVEVTTCNFLTTPLWYVCGTMGTAVIKDWELNGSMMKLDGVETGDVKPIVAGVGLTKTMAPRDELTAVEAPLPRVKADWRDYYRNVLGVIDGTAERAVKNTEVMRVMKLMEAAMESHAKGRIVRFE